MKDTGKAELQHYVPQLLLRLHLNNPAARRGSEQIWCVDKKTDRVFSPNIRGIVSGRRFYEIELDGLVLSLEGSLGKLEDAVSGILQSVLTSRSIAKLTENDRATIAAFAAVKFIRTQALRDLIRSLNSRVKEALEAQGISMSDVRGVHEMSEEEIKKLSLQMLVSAITRWCARAKLRAAAVSHRRA